jgi:monovalent cation:H+ antiporter-2, CPA2 family
MHLPPIIQDLAIIMIVGGATTLLFRAIKQPTVLGYIVAGFLIGPHFEWLPTIIEGESIKVWAEIGVIFLLFALGLEFSFKKLAKVGTPATVTALVEIGSMTAVGFLIGRAFGWRLYDSIFLGGILAISSTTIIIRAFDELEMKTRGFVKLVFGVLIVEDLVAILLMVLLSTIAVSKQFSGLEMGVASLKLGFFLALWFMLGIFLVPSLLKNLRPLLKGDTLLIVAIGLCFLMVVLATKVGFSPAFGAFIMGSILAETTDSQKIEHIIHPVKDLFGAIFFVSVGMLIDPSILADQALPVAVIFVATIVGKLLSSIVGALLAGQSLRHSVQAGLSLAQIGEFSFIIAGLGLSLGVTSEFLYPIAISVSALTTFTTPYLIKSSDHVVSFLENSLGPQWIRNLERFRANTQNSRQTRGWHQILKAEAIKASANAVIVTAVFLACQQILLPWLSDYEMNGQTTKFITVLWAMLISAPFLWGIAGRKIASQQFAEIGITTKAAAPLLALELIRWTFAVALATTLASLFLPIVKALSVVLVFLILNFFVLGRYFEQIYVNFESRFIQNLQEKESLEKKSILPPLAPWDAHLAQVTVAQNSPVVGKTLSELTVRERFGISVALIERGYLKIAAPGRDHICFPGDVLHIIGTDDQINNFRKTCEIDSETKEDEQTSDYVLEQFFVNSQSPFINKNIRESGLREQTSGLVVGIEKNGRRTLNPDSSITIEAGDILWIVGDRDRLKLLETT